MFALRECSFTITEHDPDRPWMVLSSERRTIKLPDGLEFFAWAHQQWPAPHWSVELDPWQLSPVVAMTPSFPVLMRLPGRTGACDVSYNRGPPLSGGRSPATTSV